MIWLVWHQLAQLTWLHIVLRPAGPFADWAVVACAVTVGAMMLLVAIFFVTPVRWIVAPMFGGGERLALSGEHPLSVAAAALASRFEVNSPQVYLYSSEQPNAWTCSTAWGAIVGVSSALCEMLDETALVWVLAHELAHIKHRDALTGAFWIAMTRIMAVLGWMHRWTLVLVGWTAESLGVPLWVVAVMMLPLVVVSYAAFMAEHLARQVFLLGDRFIGRQMEYRADHEASKVAPPWGGVLALSSLSDGIEPGWGLFATHPSTRRRIEAIARATKGNEQYRSR